MRIIVTGIGKAIRLQPYKIGELARMYNVSEKTFRKWLVPFKNEIGERIGHYYNIAQVKVIFEKLLLPSTIEIE